MKIMYTNSLHNNYAETKNNKTKNGMTNSVSFGAPKAPTPKTCKKAANGLAQSAQTLASEAMANINRALVRKNEKRTSSNNIEEQINHIKVNNTESVEETFKDTNDNEITLLNPKYDEKTNKLIFCKQITKKYKDSTLFEQDIYENAKFNPISEKLESCDKFTQTYNQDAENHDVEKKTYIKPKFHECISPISDWVLSFDECIINYLNNKYNRNKISQIIEKDPILNRSSEIIGYKRYEKKYDFKTRGLINETYLEYNKRKNFASKVIRTYKGKTANNGLCKEIYCNVMPNFLDNCKDYAKIYKSTDKNRCNIEPEFYPNGWVKTCYKYVNKDKDQFHTFINAYWGENGALKECEKYKFTKTEFNNDGQRTTIENINIEHPKCDINGKIVSSESKNITTERFNANGQRTTIENINIEHPEFDINGKIVRCESKNTTIKKFNDDGQLSIIQNINIEHPEFDINGNMVCCKLKNIITETFNNDGQRTTIKNINIEHPEFDTNGNLVCCKLRKSTFKYIIPQFDIVEDSQTCSNVRYYANGNMKFCEKMVDKVIRVKKDEQNRDIPYSLEAISTNVKFNENGSLDTIEKRERNYDSGIEKSEFNIKYTTQGNNHYNTELILFSDKNSPYFALAYNSHVNVLKDFTLRPQINMSINTSIIDTCMFATFADKVQTFGLKSTLCNGSNGNLTHSTNYTRFPTFPDVPNFPEFESFDKVTARPIMPARIYKEDEIEEQKTSENKDGIYIMTELDERTKQPAINIYGEDFKSLPESKQKSYLNNYKNAKKCINFLDKKFSEVPKFKAISAINSRFGIKDPRRGIVSIPSYAEEVVETNNSQNEVKEAKDFEEVKEIMPNVLEMLKDFLAN